MQIKELQNELSKLKQSIIEQNKACFREEFKCFKLKELYAEAMLDLYRERGKIMVGDTVKLVSRPTNTLIPLNKLYKVRYIRYSDKKIRFYLGDDSGVYLDPVAYTDVTMPTYTESLGITKGCYIGIAAHVGNTNILGTVAEILPADEFVDYCKLSMDYPMLAKYFKKPSAHNCINERIIVNVTHVYESGTGYIPDSNMYVIPLHKHSRYKAKVLTEDDYKIYSKSTD